MKHVILVTASAIFLSACMEDTGPKNRVVEIGNNTGITMNNFYASNTTRDTWEEDILDGDVIKNGRSINVDIDDGSGACLFDLRADFADGDIVIEKGFDVCRQGSWYVS